MSDKCRYSTSDIQDIEMVGNLGIPKSTLDEILLFKGFCSLIKIFKFSFFKFSFKNGDIFKINCLIFKNIFGLLIKMKIKGFTNIDYFRYT